MTKIWDQTQAGQARTHALILGIGAYRHLTGGPGLMISRHLGLGQLSSPPVSARYFSDWLIKNFKNDDAPLGSVELLLAESNLQPYELPDHTRVDVEEATIDNIERAFNEWLDRCDQENGNAAIFYFCGHGVLIQGDQLLLASDYGRNRRQPFGSAINFEQMHQGMANIRAGLQCFFIDACSNVPVDGLDIANAGARSFLGATFPGPRQPLTLVLRAAAPGNSAYARKNAPSRFTEALVQCLDGRGCAPSPERGKWVVTTTNLVDAVYQVIDWLNRNEGGPVQIPNATKNVGRGRIHMRDHPPAIPVIIRFDPEQATAEAEITLQSMQKPGWSLRRAPAPGIWLPGAVEAGPYFLKATFTARTYADIDLPLIITPPGPVPEPIPVEEIK